MRIALCLLCLVLPSLVPGPVRGAELALGAEPYRYTVIDQDLRTALREFGANMGVRIALSDAVQGRIRGRMPPLAPLDFLNRVAELYGLDWYYDGYIVSVTGQSEGTSRVIATPGVRFDELRAGLEALGVLDRRYLARPQTPGSDMVLVGGPPRYLELMEQTASLLVARARGRSPAPAGALVATEAAPPPPGPAAPVRLTGLSIYRAAAEQRVVFPQP